MPLFCKCERSLTLSLVREWPSCNNRNDRTSFEKDNDTELAINNSLESGRGQRYVVEGTTGENVCRSDRRKSNKYRCHLLVVFSFSINIAFDLAHFFFRRIGAHPPGALDWSCPRHLSCRDRESASLLDLEGSALPRSTARLKPKRVQWVFYICSNDGTRQLKRAKRVRPRKQLLLLK
jgi:hypothetical protein